MAEQTNIGLGTNAVGGHNIYPNLSEEVSKDAVRTALDNGINFLDTKDTTLAVRLTDAATNPLPAIFPVCRRSLLQIS